MNKLEKSEKLFEQACRIIPRGVNSPVRAFGQVGGSPVFVEKGEGAYIYDVDGNRYIDYCQSWGASILGHAHPRLVKAVQKQAELGTSFGIPTEAEIRLAEIITGNHPSVEMVRCVSSGTEAVMSALRLARGFTGRKGVLKFDGGYHGHVDYLLVKAGSGLATLGLPGSAGVTEENVKHTYSVKLNDIEAVDQVFAEHGDEIACILVEGIPANNGLLVQSAEFMKHLEQTAHKHGALLVVDEVITGFRVGLQGAVGLYQLNADIVTLGKVIGGGLPVGAFGARADVMEKIAPLGPVYQAGTLSGNPLAMASGVAVLTELVERDAYSELEEKGAHFERGLREIISDHDLPMNLSRAGSVFWFSLDGGDPPKRASEISSDSIKRYSVFFHRMLEKGFYFAPSGYEVGFMTTAHTKEMIDDTLTAMADVLPKIF